MTAAERKLRRRVQAILTLWTIPEAERAAEKASMALSPEARKFWHSHYRPKFTQTLKGGRTWEEDGLNVLIASRNLGALAARIAKEAGHPKIDKNDADLATKDLDCNIGLPKGALPRGAWCL